MLALPAWSWGGFAIGPHALSVRGHLLRLGATGAYVACEKGRFAQACPGNTAPLPNPTQPNYYYYYYHHHHHYYYYYYY